MITHYKPTVENKWEYCCQLKIDIDKLEAQINAAYNQKREQETIIRSSSQLRSEKMALIMKALK